MNETEHARQLANIVLDRRNADPDDDFAVLSRQLLRAFERIATLESRIVIDVSRALALKEAAAIGADYSKQCRDRIELLHTESGTAALEAHDAELRLLMACGHPKACRMGAGPSISEPAYCTVCKEMADKVNQAVLAESEWMYTHSHNVKEMLEHIAANRKAAGQ